MYSINIYKCGQLDWECEETYPTREEAEEVARREQTFVNNPKIEYRVVEVTAEDYADVEA